jgi:hypothetical protein
VVRHLAKASTKYPKEITLYIRVDPGLKKHLEKKAAEVGLKLSSYARMKLMEISEFKA